MIAGAEAGSSPRSRIQIDGGASFELTADEDTLLRGALRAGVAWPYECSVGGCGACRFDLLDGEMATLWPEAPGLSERDRRRGKRLACQSRPLGDCRVRVRLEVGEGEPSATPPITPRRLQATLRARRAITPDMDEFVLHVPGAPQFRAGQYALLYPPGVDGARAYSMSNLSNADGEGEDLWRFIIRRMPGGRGSQALFEQLTPGRSITFDGPYGHAHLRDGTRDVVCIAGGSGLGPMLSVARGVLAAPGARSVHFFLGLRQQAELGALRELDGLDAARLQVCTVLSSPDPGLGWDGATGFVHAEVERALAGPLDRYDHYFAGPPRMIEAMQELLMVRHRVPFEQIHFDRFV